MVCFVLTGLPTWILGCRWLEGQGEQAGAAQAPCTSSVEATGQLCASLQEESLQCDTGTIPLLHGKRIRRHLPVDGRDPCLPSSLRSCHSFRADLG